MSYWLNNLIAIDQLCNTLLKGTPDETLSARSYRQRESRPFWYKLINKIFFWQDDHCHDSYLSEVNRKHLPRNYQDGN
jgi:hypothetical protein